MHCTRATIADMCALSIYNAMHTSVFESLWKLMTLGSPAQSALQYDRLLPPAGFRAPTLVQWLWYLTTVSLQLLLTVRWSLLDEPMATNLFVLSAIFPRYSQASTVIISLVPACGSDNRKSTSHAHTTILALPLPRRCSFGITRISIRSSLMASLKVRFRLFS